MGLFDVAKQTRSRDKCMTEGRKILTTAEGHPSIHAGSLDVLYQESIRNEQKNDFKTGH